MKCLSHGSQEYDVWLWSQELKGYDNKVIDCPYCRRYLSHLCLFFSCSLLLSDWSWSWEYFYCCKTSGPELIIGHWLNHSARRKDRLSFQYLRTSWEGENKMFVLLQILKSSARRSVLPGWLLWASGSPSKLSSGPGRVSSGSEYSVLTFLAWRWEDKLPGSESYGCFRLSGPDSLCWHQACLIIIPQWWSLYI